MSYRNLQSQLPLGNAHPMRRCRDHHSHLWLLSGSYGQDVSPVGHRISEINRPPDIPQQSVAIQYMLSYLDMFLSVHILYIHTISCNCAQEFCESGYDIKVNLQMFMSTCMHYSQIISKNQNHHHHSNKVSISQVSSSGNRLSELFSPRNT